MSQQTWRDSRFWGCVLLVVGTSVGGGMLALPVASAQMGFGYSSLSLLAIWGFMTMCSLIILEVNQWLPPGTNIISMASATLGRPGRVLAWLAYLSLLYALLAAYTAAGADVFHTLFSFVGLDLPHWIGEIGFITLLAAIVFCGIRSVDYINRYLMLLKFTSYALLITFVAPKVNVEWLHHKQLAAIPQALTLIITSFGFASIVPSLRTYCQDNIPLLRRVIIVGSLIPLVCYILWNATIMGVIPAYTLETLNQNGHVPSALMSLLEVDTRNLWLNTLSRTFISVCTFTSFLAVSLGLTDFLADGLALQKKGRQGLIVLALTFLPPLFFVLFSPHIFVTALNYAGILCVVLLALLPILMAWNGRYRRRIPAAQNMPLTAPVPLTMLGVLTVVILFIGVWKKVSGG